MITNKTTSKFRLSWCTDNSLNILPYKLHKLLKTASISLFFSKPAVENQSQNIKPEQKEINFSFDKQIPFKAAQN
jgi:hypothetical protein